MDPFWAGFNLLVNLEPISAVVKPGKQLLVALFDVIQVCGQPDKDKDRMKHILSVVRSIITDVNRDLLSLEQQLHLGQESRSNSARWAAASLKKDLDWAAQYMDMDDESDDESLGGFSFSHQALSELAVGVGTSFHIKVLIIILDVAIKEQRKQEDFRAYLSRLSEAALRGVSSYYRSRPRPSSSHRPGAGLGLSGIWWERAAGEEPVCYGLYGASVDSVGWSKKVPAVKPEPHEWHWQKDGNLDLYTAITITQSMRPKELFADVSAILEGRRDRRPDHEEQLVALLACLDHSKTLSALPPSARSWASYFLDGEHEASGGNGTRGEVRLRIMTAVSNCRSLREINLNPLSERGRYSVRVVEATALLNGLTSNPDLQVLNLYWFKGFGTTDACGALSAAVLRPRPSRLVELDMQGLGLSVEGLGHISAALRDNSRSPLRVLFLDDNAVGSAAGALHVARILTHSPELRTLGLAGIEMDTEGARLIADAVARTATLEHLRIGYDREKNPEQAAMLVPLLTALTRGASPNVNASITQLHLEVTGLAAGAEDRAAEAALAEAAAAMLQSNTTLNLLRVSSFFVTRGLWALALNSSITILELVHQQSLDDEVPDPLDQLMPILQKCKNVEGLQLVFKEPYGPSKFTKELFQGLKHNTPRIKRLLLDGWEGLDDEMFEDMIQSLSTNTNTNLEHISIKDTQWHKHEGKRIGLAVKLTAACERRRSRTCPPAPQSSCPPARTSKATE